MTKPTIRIHDITTDELIDRQMTDAEFAAYEAEKSKHAEELAVLTEAQQAKEAAQAKLAALGLTTDDLKALGLGGN